jgi:hypothetical protein
MVVNAVYWALGLESKISAKAHVDLIQPYHPSPFKFGGFQRQRKPEDF